MLNYLNKIKKSQITFISIMLIFLIGISNLLNYAFHVLMARMLGPGDYSVLAVLTNILYIFTIPVVSIQTILSSRTTSLLVKKDLSSIKMMFNILLKKTFFASVILFFFFSLFSIFLRYKLGIPYFLLILTGLFIFLAIAYPIAAGIIQGMKKFMELGFNSIINSFVKLIVSITLVFLGFRVYGAIIGFLLGMFIAFLFILIPIRTIPSSKIKNIEKIKEKYIDKKSLLIFWTMLCFVLIYSLDVIFVKAFFNPETAGKYAVISMIGKIILFSVLSIGTVMFPINSEKFLKGHKTRNVLIKSLGLSIFICFSAIILIALFPKVIITVLFGKIYLDLSGLLIYVSLAFSFISISNIVILYQISINRLKIKNLIGIVFALVLEIISMFFFSKSITSFSKGFMVTSLILFVISLLIIRKK